MCFGFDENAVIHAADHRADRAVKRYEEKGKLLRKRKELGFFCHAFGIGKGFLVVQGSVTLGVSEKERIFVFTLPRKILRDLFGDLKYLGMGGGGCGNGDGGAL